MRWCHLQESCSVAVKPCAEKVCVFAVRHQTPQNPTDFQTLASFHDRFNRNRFCLNCFTFIIYGDRLVEEVFYVRLCNME